ncbi:outer membrane protein assembly factor [Flavobacterium piscinae]|uniref:Outer membrane protein assembly factor n=1 Tax=Flavobacterium piscinae TaxID=2506424 RepID=A0A4Q1KYZ1_9FLAO|nr:BamA/TamA family outer membrane protein [Flavobacterium piscinae]RXR35552.1 outer membrane protein assembly factor [Flavobacterium piscinae]
MKEVSTKISLLFLIVLFFYACDSTKRVPNGKKLLAKSVILVDNNKENSEEVTELLSQKTNTKFLNLPFSLYFYNWAKPNHDSLFAEKFLKDSVRFERISKLLSSKQVYRLGESFWYSGIHNFLKNTGEPPIILDEAKTKKSLTKLKAYYFNQGYFNVDATIKIDSIGLKKVATEYNVTLGKPYIIDTINHEITSPVLDSLYGKTKYLSNIKSGEQYKSDNFESERNRLTNNFRNNGVYNFQQNYISFDIDTIKTGNKANVNLLISDYSFRAGDSLITTPFKIYKISEVNIYTDNPSSKNKVKIVDSVVYNNYNLYSIDKLKYRPKAITDAVFITKGGIYADYKNNLTSRSLNNFKVFTYPSIQYEVDPRDSLQSSLIANIYLSPRKKYSFGASFDALHSNIQDFGLSGNTSFSIRNLFNGAETFEIAARGNIGSSQDLANPDNTFFNISEYGADMRLNFPRLFFPIKTDKILPKEMIPSTQISLGFAKQQNIGLDKENFTGSITYNWTPKRYNAVRFDLVNIQYIKNINVNNYFNVYRSSYAALNNIANNYLIEQEYLNENGNLTIPIGTNWFLDQVLGENQSINPTPSDLDEIRSINERKNRLTENNLIIASSYSFSKTTKTNLLDNNFYVLRTKLETAGNLLSLFADGSNQPLGPNGNKTFFDIEFSQYVKAEFEYIKHFDLRNNKVFATRTFFGIAIPYGNSNSIPFSRSYFGGGSNDNRAWRPYGLGPGRSGARNDFNEANMKILLNAEFRFKIFGKLRGVLFVDAGNIWNVLDNVEDEELIFDGLASLKDIAVGSGFGFRYDFGFVVARFDFGFKTYNPAHEEGKRWFREYNFSNTVFNVGINYPF